MRRILSAMAIAAAALGLLWLVRLDRTTPQRDASAPSAASASSAERAEPELASAPATAAALGPIGGTLPATLVDPRVVVAKSRRTLAVFSEGRVAKVYRIALGSRPVGDKEREGDRRTPEGVFYICSKNTESKYHLALGISYPDSEDASRGVAAGIISKREQRAIDDAVAHYRRPPWNTALGGEIMVHGGGTDRDWTTGCVALSDSDIEEIFPMLPMGTEVEIRP